jgi:hypothetical protein
VSVPQPSHSGSAHNAGAAKRRRVRTASLASTLAPSSSATRSRRKSPSAAAFSSVSSALSLLSQQPMEAGAAALQRVPAHGAAARRPRRHQPYSINISAAHIERLYLARTDDRASTYRGCDRLALCSCRRGAPARDAGRCVGDMWDMRPATASRHTAKLRARDSRHHRCRSHAACACARSRSQRTHQRRLRVVGASVAVDARVYACATIRQGSFAQAASGGRVDE